MQEGKNFLLFVQPKYTLPCPQNLSLASVLLLMSAGHILISHSFKIPISTIVQFTHFPPSGVLASGIPVKILCAYFLFVMRAIILAHLVLLTTNYVFRPFRHWLLVSRTFR